MKQVTSKELCKNKIGTGATEIFAVGASSGLSIQLTGVATTFKVNFEGSLDGVNWSPIEGNLMSSQSTFVTSLNRTVEVVSFYVDTVGCFRCDIIENNSVGGISILGVSFID